MPDPIVNEGSQSEEGATHPETVPYHKYIGVKEMLSKAETKATNLAEQLKQAPSAEEHARIKAELETEKAERKKASDELNTFKEQSLSGKRATLIARGVAEEDIKNASEKELMIISKALGEAKPVAKPAPDFGGGGGSGSLKGSPLDLARQAYASSNRK
jgi:hypothetical protein